MKNYFVLPYKRGSQAAKRIKEGIRAKMIRLVGSRWRPTARKLVINWGHTQPPLNIGVQVLNRPVAVVNAVNKAVALAQLYGANIAIPDFTTNVNEARQWFDTDPNTVVFCRTLLRSSGGKGIVIAKSAAELVNAPLFTKRVKKRDEYRVHVFQGAVIDVAHKRLKNGKATEENRNAYVRNHENGWIFAHQNVVCPDNVKEIAVKAVNALSLDFGAVDIGVNKAGEAFVFEVNTAPGLENQQTIQAYINAFNNYKKKEEEKDENARALFPQAQFRRR